MYTYCIYDDYVYYVLADVISAIFQLKNEKWKYIYIYDDDDDDGVSENENPV